MICWRFVSALEVWQGAVSLTFVLINNYFIRCSVLNVDMWWYSCTLIMPSINLWRYWCILNDHTVIIASVMKLIKCDSSMSDLCLADVFAEEHDLILTLKRAISMLATSNWNELHVWSPATSLTDVNVLILTNRTIHSHDVLLWVCCISFLGFVSDCLARLIVWETHWNLVKDLACWSRERTLSLVSIVFGWYLVADEFWQVLLLCLLDWWKIFAWPLHFNRVTDVSFLSCFSWLCRVTVLILRLSCLNQLSRSWRHLLCAIGKWHSDHFVSNLTLPSSPQALFIVRYFMGLIGSSLFSIYLTFLLCSLLTDQIIAFLKCFGSQLSFDLISSCQDGIWQFSDRVLGSS